MSVITLTHKIRLDPTCKQENYFRQACGVARFTWNWALAEWKKQYEAGNKPNGLDLKKQFNAIKPIEFPWTYNVTKYASQQPFIFLQTAFRRFFNNQSNYPQFKKKGVHDRFYIGNDHIKMEIEGPKPLNKLLKKLKKLQRQLSRKQKGSRNRYKARMKVARLHYRIASIRQDGLHKLTSYLTGNYGAIAIEDLDVKDMLKHRYLARAIADMGFHEFRRQLIYKAHMRGNPIEIADRWFPSSKRCSTCGKINGGLTLSDRIFRCGDCGLEMDRDLNAAINLFSTVSSTGFQACGEEGSGLKATLSENQPQ